MTVASGAPANLDLKLVKTRNLAAQLSNLEWITSVPGTDEQRRALSGCVNCHTLERIINSKHDAEAMLEVIRRMATYSNNSFHAMPQIRAEARDLERFVPGTAKVAAYFASINLSKGERTWELKTLPRVKGSGTRVVITEYDLPDPTIQPHDVMVDPDGVVWHSDFSGQRLGRFDTRTLAHKVYPVPLQRQGWPTGALDLQTDPQGNLWLGLMFQAGTAKFDRKTETFQMFQLPPHLLKDDSQTALVGPQNWTVDNRIWLQDPSRRGIYRMNVVTGHTELFEPFAKTRGSPYSIFSDPQNNIWFLDFGGQNHWPDRCGEWPDHALSDAHAPVAPAPRAARRPRTDLVCRVCWRTRRHVRHQDRNASGNGRCRAGSSRPTTSPTTSSATCGPAE